MGFKSGYTFEHLNYLRDIVLKKKALLGSHSKQIQSEILVRGVRELRD